MDASTLDWLITLLAVHVVGLAGLIALFRGAPCWMQRLAVIGLILAFIVFCVAYMAALCDVERWYHILLIGFVLEHLAVLVYIFRINWQRGHDGNADRAAPQVR